MLYVFDLNAYNVSYVIFGVLKKSYPIPLTLNILVVPIVQKEKFHVQPSTFGVLNVFFPTPVQLLVAFFPCLVNLLICCCDQSFIIIDFVKVNLMSRMIFSSLINFINIKFSTLIKML